MKGTVVDGNFRYRATMQARLQALEEAFPVRLKNRSRFGITVEKGMQFLEQDLAEGLLCDYALVEFGGNDCDFCWNEISASPEGQHQPRTPLVRFVEVLQSMVELLRQKNIRPVLMTLPPIHAERYLAFVSRGENCKERILRWLGDVNMIYRFHESYSAAITKIAAKTDAVLVDIREQFLHRHDYPALIGADGIHLSPSGYQVVFDTFHAILSGMFAAKPQFAPV